MTSENEASGLGLQDQEETCERNQDDTEESDRESLLEEERNESYLSQLEEDVQVEVEKEKENSHPQEGIEDTSCSSCTKYSRQLKELDDKVHLLERKLEKVSFSVSLLENNNKLVTFFTGLLSWDIFQEAFCFLSPFASPPGSLNLQDELLLTLSRLWLGLLFDDLAVRFGISNSTASRIFNKLLELLYVHLRFVISWPSRDVCQHNMPSAFKEMYPSCRCILDCSEIFIDIRKSYPARSKTYKKHNTIKFQIAITFLCFLSNCWGGRVSDKNLTQACGFLNFLEQGDVLLADRGFNVGDDIGLHGAKLEIPAFTCGKSQLTQRDVKISKKL